MKQTFFIKSISLIFIAFFALPTLVWARTGNDPKSFQTAYEQVGMYKAWDYSTGSSDVIVAVIDNGFDTFHPDLYENVWQNTKEIPGNGFDDDHNGYIDDVWGWSFLDETNNPQPSVANLTDEEKKDGLFSHGTFVAGIIGALGNNNRDGAGINWRVKLMNIRVLGNNGYGQLTPLGKAIRYAVDNGAQVINISMVGDKDENTESAIRYAYEKGVVVVAAMGNYNGNLNNNLMYPACADADAGLTMVLGVSAVNTERRLASFSNTGSKCVDITAPGVDIASTVRYSPNDGLSQTYVRGWQGTSFATPFVSGAAALVKSIRPEWKASQIYQALLSTTHHTPADDEAAYAQSYGKGLLQVHRAVAYAMGLTIPPTMFETSTPSTVNTTTLFAVLPKNQKTFSVVWPNSELRDAYADNSPLGAMYERPEAKNIESIANVGVGRDQKIITARPKNKTERQITVYNYRWQEEATWNVLVTGSVSISAIQRDNGLTIGVSPTIPHTQMYWLYDQTGNLLESKMQKNKHSGARVLVGLTDTYVVVGNSVQNKQTINIFNYKNGEIITEFSADEYTAFQNTSVLPTVALGDVVGNSDPEIILGSALGAQDMITIYSSNGSLLRSFAPFGNGASGANVLLFDADGNGSLDLVTHPVVKPTIIRAWSGRAKLVGEWSIPNFSKNFFLLPRK